MDCKHEEAILYPTNIEIVNGNVVIKDLENCDVFCKNCRKPMAYEDIHYIDPSKRFVGVPKRVLD